MGKLTVLTNPPKSPPPGPQDLESILQAGLAAGEQCLVATGKHARRLIGDLAELKGLRLKAHGGFLFKRSGSPYWQARYRVDEKLRDESTGITDRKAAERWLAFKVYEASAGRLPGTASIEQILDMLVEDAKFRRLKSVARIAQATKALKLKLAGSRAEELGYHRWQEYANQRQAEAIADDTIHFELSVARRAYRLASKSRLVRSIPEMPRMKLRVRHRFATPEQWRTIRQHLRPELRDAGDFAFLTGARAMEALGLPWLDLDSEVVNLRGTKTGTPRAIPYAGYPQLREVIARRLAVREELKRKAVISPWVFCSPAGARLFKDKASGERELKSALRAEWNSACARAGLPGLLFHDLRRSAARNFERAAVPRSVAMKIAGWNAGMYSRYAIGADNEAAEYLPRLSAYVGDLAAQWHSRKKARGIKHFLAGEGS